MSGLFLESAIKNTRNMQKKSLNLVENRRYILEARLCFASPAVRPAPKIQNLLGFCPASKSTALAARCIENIAQLVNLLGYRW